MALEDGDFLFHLIDEAFERLEREIAKMVVFTRAVSRHFIMLFKEPEFFPRHFEFSPVLESHSKTSTTPLGMSCRSEPKIVSTRK